MRKKLIVLLIVAAIAVSSAVATPLLQIGPMVAYNNGIINISNDAEKGELSIHSFTFGADIRLNLFNWVSIDVPATYGYANPGIHTIGLLPSLNLNIPAVSWLDIAVGVGLHMDFEYDQDSKNWYINGYDMERLEKAIYGASLDYRLALTFNLGSVSIGATAFFPMDGNFEKLSPMPKWEETRVSLSVLFNIV